MNLIKWNDFDGKLPSMFSAFDDIFGQDYFKSLATGMSTPAMNIEEHEDRFVLSLAVPGLEKKDCKVEVEGGVLTISSQKETEQEEKGEHTRYEYNFSSFSRSFVLPENVAVEEIEAECKNGELKIRLPKQEVNESEVKEIDIH